MERLGYSGYIIKKISNIPYGQPIHAETITNQLAEQFAIPITQAKQIGNVTLKRMADKGQLERFQKGIYYRAKQTVFGKAHPSKDVLEAQLMMHQGEEIIGYETGVSLLNHLGLTTLVPRKREIVTNAFRKKISDQHILVKKPVTKVTAENYRYLQILDAIRDLPKTQIDAENPNALLHSFVQQHALEPVKILAYARQYYPQKTLLKLVNVLVEGEHR